jgi:class 3 adenylate cyclase
LDAEALATRIAQLETEVGRQQVLHQRLVGAKGRIDRELQRFQAIQAYVQKAVLVENLTELNVLTLEAIIEAFEFEVALFLDWNGQLSVAESFGFEQEPPTTLPFEKGWLADCTSRVLKGDDPILRAWSTLALRDAIVAPLSDKEGSLSGVLVGGRTIARGELYDAVSAEQRSSFEVLASQAEALFRNFAMAAEIREHNRRLQALTRSYSRFVPFEFLELLGRASIEAVLPADQIRLDMTIMFADLRDFTATSEALGAERAFALLNEYLQAMEPQISACGGFINQYLGDGFIALFHGGADNAVTAAIGMGRALVELNAKRIVLGEPVLRIGVGINSGELMLGAIGGEQRLDSNVVGDAVNLASRVEGLTKLYGTTCVVTDGTVAKLSEPVRYALRELDRVVVVGRTAPVVIYELLELAPADQRKAKLATAADFQCGMASYRNGDFGAAAAAFARCLKACADDRAASLYMQRCAELAQGTPAGGWHGITVLDRKQ